MKTLTLSSRIALLLAVALPVFGADGLSEKLQHRVDERIEEAKAWAALPAVVDSVAAQNAQLPPKYLGLTLEKWEQLPELDPLVRGLTKSPAALALKAKKTDAITEAFVSDAKGFKVGFLNKSTRWNHLGKPKHDVPMSGHVWQGKLELDKSSGARQIQIAVPVLKDNQPIGSLVVGISLSDLVG
ncbi:MAG: hypothetical protein ABIZ04_22925 [Opitutus sp.]